MASCATTIIFCLTLGLASTSILCNKERSSSSRSCLLQVSKQANNDDIRHPSSIKVIESDDPIPPTEPHICIIARACGNDTDCAPGRHRDPPGPQGSTPDQIVQGFLSTMAAQTYSNFELHLINTQGGNEIYTQLVPWISDSRIVNGPSYPHQFENNTWGYAATNYALEEVLKEPQKTCDYFLFTNADNVYGRYFLESGLKGMAKGLDLVGSHFVTRYAVQAEKWGETSSKPHTPMRDVKFEYRHIDLGAVLISAKPFVDDGLRFNLGLPEDQEADADWHLFDAIMKRDGHAGAEITIENQFIHQ